jgi:CTD small phosphatase-like protein 2
MIVDNNPESFLLQPENGILIKSWYDDVDDTALEELEVVLYMIDKSKIWDLRKALRSLRKKILKKTQDVNNR